jgi:signal peptide peptidase SppA
MTRVGRSAVVRLKGPLLKADSWMVDWFGGTSMERARVAVLSAAADSSVDAIILDVDSPGGTVDGTDDLAAAVAAAAKSKAVIAQVGGMAASAAYWVASQATEIRMQRLDMVGSIGVRLLMYDFSKLFESEGIRPVLIDTGVHKSTGAMGVPISEEQEAEQRRVVERFYGEFLGAVQRGRGMTAAALKPYADGRLFFADEAVTAGLADKVVPRDATLGEAARSAETAARLRRARAVGI